MLRKSFGRVAWNIAEHKRKMMPEPTRFAIYSRKSKFTGRGESIDNQIELCKDYIRVNFGESVVFVYEDEGFSGKNTDRPQFKKLMADGMDGKFDILICYRLDRISRNIGDFATLITDLNRKNIDFISVRERFDTSTPLGRAMMYIASVFSQLERETIAERIRDNMLELAKTGRWLGGTTPTGYKSFAMTKITLDGREIRLCKLDPIQNEQETVTTIFKKYLEYQSLSAVETYLLLNGTKTKNGKNFSRFSIRNILENPVYAIADNNTLMYFHDKGIEVYSDAHLFDGSHGVMAYNKTFQAPSRAKKRRNPAEWVIAIGAHQGIVTGWDWARVQEILELNTVKSYRKPRVNPSCLSGLVRCGLCGELMRPKMHEPTLSPERSFSYLCQTKDRSKGTLCTAKNINGRNTDCLVLSAIAKIVQSAEYCKYDSLLLPPIPKPSFNERGGYKPDSLDSVAMQALTQIPSRLIKDCFIYFDKLDLLQKRRLLRIIIKEVVVHHDHISLVLHGSGEMQVVEG